MKVYCPAPPPFEFSTEIGVNVFVFSLRWKVPSISNFCISILFEKVDGGWKLHDQPPAFLPSEFRPRNGCEVLYLFCAEECGEVQVLFSTPYLVNGGPTSEINPNYLSGQFLAPRRVESFLICRKILYSLCAGKCRLFRLLCSTPFRENGSVEIQTSP